MLFYDVFVSITDIDHTMLRMRIIEAGCVQGGLNYFYDLSFKKKIRSVHTRLT